MIGRNIKRIKRIKRIKHVEINYFLYKFDYI